MNAAIFRFFFY
ncbi:TPA: pheST operon leader peptide PheM, partial [Escherichia coli]|nr:pheST operon leader peptide PheM [Escherichia coli]